LDPRGCSRQALRLCALALLACWGQGCRTPSALREPTACLPTAQRPASSADGDARQEAERLLARGQAAEAERLLQELRPDPASPAYGQVLFLKARIAVARSQRERAMLYLGELLLPEHRSLHFAAHQARAELAFQAKDFEMAYRAYLAAVNSAATGMRVPARTWLRLAQIAWYENRDAERADYYARRSEPEVLSAPERDLLERLRRRLSWRQLTPEAIGLGDGNVSALRVDGDDLWIGTWNGGVCRFTLSSGEARVFREGRDSLVPSTVRCIEVTPARVWIGTYQGLFAYSKSGGAWQEIGAFGGADPRKVEALRVAGGRLYVGTLGQGLWRQESEGWSRVSSGLLPGDFVTCLEVDGGNLLIGTLNQGVVLLNLASQTLASFDETEAGLAARNITMLLAEPPQGFWIGTYGKGVYRWDRLGGRLTRFTRAAGQLGDDWVLCAVQAASGTYFGTLGGGLARFSRGAWEVLGFREGVSAPDIPALAYDVPFLFLGSLGTGVTVLREAEP